MIRARALALMGMVLAGAVVWRAATVSAESTEPAAAPAPSTALGQYTAWQAWKLYCVECHIGPRAPAGLNLQALDLNHLESNGAIWEKLMRKLRNREMPPAGMPRPDEATYLTLGQFHRDGTRSRRAAQAQSRTHHAPSPQPDRIRERHPRFAGARDRRCGHAAGRRHRLRLRQYRRRAEVSPLLMERYLDRSRQDQPARPSAIPRCRWPIRPISVSHGLNQDDRMSEDMPLGSRGGTFVRHHFPVDAEYDVSVSSAGERPTRSWGWSRTASSICGSTINGSNCSPFRPSREQQNVLGSGHDPDAHLKVRLPVKAGTHEIAATFLKDTMLSGGHSSATSPRRAGAGPPRRRGQRLRSPVPTRCKGRA